MLTFSDLKFRVVFVRAMLKSDEVTCWQRVVMEVGKDATGKSQRSFKVAHNQLNHLPAVARE